MAVNKVLPDVPDAVDNRYYVVLYNPNDRGQYKKVIRGKRAAEHHEVEMKVRLAGGGLASATDRQVTVRELLDEIIASKRTLAANTLLSYRRTLDNHIYPAIGPMRVARLATGYLALVGLFEQVEHDSGRGARERVELLVRRMLTVAVREGIIARNPLDGVPWVKPAAVRGPVYAPEWADILRIRQDVIDHRARTLPGTVEMALAQVDTIAGAGVRVGELMGLAVDDVDHDAQTVTVRRQLLYVAGEGYLFGPPKTDDSGPRTIPVPAFVLAAIAATRLRNGSRSMTLPWEHADGKPHTANLLFYSIYEPGKAASSASLSKRLTRIGERLELPGALHAHCYRHRYTTTLHDAGVPQRVIDYVTGHLSAGSISMLYTQVTKDGLARARKAIDDAWVTATQESERPAMQALPQPS